MLPPSPRLLLASCVLFAWASCSHAASVSLQWDYAQNPQELAVSFNVYRDSDCLGVYTVIATIAITGPTSQAYIDLDDPSSPLLPAHNYCYQVTAMAADGKESGPSNTVQFSVPLQQSAPNNPTGLRGVVVQ